MKVVVFRLVAIVAMLTLPISAWAQGSSADWDALNREVVSLYEKGQYNQAVIVAKRALDLAEREDGGEHLNVAKSLNTLARLYQTQGEYELAEPLFIRSIEIRHKTLGPEHPDVALGLNNLAELYRAQGQYSEAEQFHRKSLTIRLKALGPQHPDVALSLNNLALIFEAWGNFTQAEQFYKLSLRITEKAFGPEAPEVGTSLSNLAGLLIKQGKYDHAEPLLIRSLVILEKALGPEHPDVAVSLNNLASFYYTQGQIVQAESLFIRSLAILEKALGPEHPNVAGSLNALATLYRKQGNDTQAELLHKRSLAIREQVLGPNHPDVATSLNNLASVYYSRGQYALAEPLLIRSLVILEKALGPEHPDVASSLNNLSVVLYKQQRTGKAIEYSRLGFNLLSRRFSVGTGNAVSSQTELKTKRGEIIHHIQILDDYRDASSVTESFEAFQLAQASGVGHSVAQMAARFSAQGGELAKLIREQQDSAERLSRTDKALVQAIGQPTEKIDAARVTALRGELAALEKALGEQGREIASRFPEYDALMSTAPIPAAEAQKLLRSDEALVAYLVDYRGIFAWVLRPDRMDFRRLDITAESLTDQVAKLRAQLDPMQNRKLQPFDEKASHGLYLKVFAPLESELAGVRHVILIADGALQGLPFPVLADKAAEGAAPASWLADRYAFSSVPSVSALRALRTFTRTAPGAEPFVGFGDPVLGGRKGEQRRLAARSLFAVTDAGEAGKLRSGIADVRAISMAPPLPDTAVELRALAKSLAAPATSLYLRDKATEANAKQLDLSRYRVLAFATHGVMAGEMTGVVEPGLILTPPKEGTLLDDGYLSASEVAQLKLNADWVLLSACNTAAPDGTPGAEGLSGLAKAFFYAGARSLLVSNWYVVSDAAVQLTTEMLRRYAADSKLGKAEALRLSMQKLRSNPKYAHPLFWAPFVVVGEGGVAARPRER